MSLMLINGLHPGILNEDRNKNGDSSFPQSVSVFWFTFFTSFMSSCLRGTEKKCVLRVISLCPWYESPTSLFKRKSDTHSFPDLVIDWFLQVPNKQLLEASDAWQSWLGTFT